MKILRFDLIRFGHFADRSIDLSAGQQGLHLIVGPNEAGKSTFLRGLTDWLFGFEASTRKAENRDTQRWSASELRVGGMLQHHDGRTLDFVRRVTKPTLLNRTQDEPVDPRQLEDFIRGLDRNSFSRQWGIDYQALQAGGQEIVEGQGELGQLLFAAGSGLRRLGKVLKELQDEQREIFLPRGQKSTLNQLLQDHKKLHESLRAAQLPTDTYTRLQQQVAQASLRSDQLSERTASVQRKLDELTRLQNALTPWTRWRFLDQSLRELPPGRVLAGDFAHRHFALLERKIACEAQLRDLQPEIQKLEDALGRLKPMPSLLEAAANIHELVDRRGAHAKAEADAIALSEQRKQLRQQQQTQLSSLEIDPSRLADSLDQISLTRRTALEELIDRQEQLRSRAERLNEAQQQSTEALAELDQQVAAPAQNADPVLIEGLCESLRQAIAERSQSEQNLSKARQHFERACNSLGTAQQSPQELHDQQAPAVEWVEQQIDRWNQCRQRESLADEALASTSREIETKCQERDSLQGIDSLPTREDVDRVRAQRDSVLSKLQSLFREVQQWPDRSIVQAECERQVESLEQHVQQADRLLDALLSGHELASRRQAILAALDQLRARQTKATEEQRAIQLELEHLALAWHVGWKDLPPAGWEPARAPTWLGRWQASRESAVALLTAEQQHQRAEEALSVCVEETRKAMAPWRPQTATLATALLSQAQQVAQQARQVQANTQAHAQSRERMKRQLDRSTAELEAHRMQAADWERDWLKLLNEIRWPQDYSPRQARLILQAHDQVRDTNRLLQELEQRLEDISRDSAAFSTRVHQLASMFGVDAPASPLSTLVDRIQGLLDQAKAIDVEQQSLHARLKAFSTSRDEKLDELRRLHAGMTALCQEADCPSLDALPDAIERSRRRANLQQQLEQTQIELQTLAQPIPWQTFCQPLEHRSATDIQESIDRLIEERDRIAVDRSPADQELGSLRSQLSTHRGSDQAAEVNQELDENETRQASLAARYARLKMSETVLRYSIDRYRRDHEGPLLRRASELFRDLTGGSFEQIRAELTDKQQPILHGIRKGSTTPVQVSQMSAGTADQLYLALRLASLLEHVAHHPPMPLIIDDLLVMFDEQRASAALKVLGEVARHTQVVFLTHHEHLRELALESVAPDQLYVHSL